MNLKIFTEFPFWTYTLCIIIGFIYSFSLYYKDKRFIEHKRILIYALSLLRFILVTFIALLVLAPIINRNIKSNEKPTIVFAIDNSESMKISADSSALSAISAKIEQWNQDLNDQYVLRYYLFSDKIISASNPDFSGKFTDINSALGNLEQLYYNRNLGAVVLLTDGNYNKGANPIYKAQELSFPVYSIVYGDSVQKPDLLISGIENNDITFLNDSFPVRINFNAVNLPDQQIELQIVQRNKTVYQEKVQIISEKQSFQKDLLLKATQPGLQEYNVRLKEVDNELSVANNVQRFYIDVLDSRKKVLVLYQSPHPDIGAITGALSLNENLEIIISDIRSEIPPISSLNMVILHQIPDNSKLYKAYLDTIKQLNIPVLFIMGQNTSIPALSSFTGQKLQQSAAAGFEELFPEINNNFTAFITGEVLSDFTQKLPPLIGKFGIETNFSPSDVLFYKKIRNIITEEPLMAFTTKNEWKIGYIFGEGIWRWKIYDYKNHGNSELFNELINKTIQYLSLSISREQFIVNAKKTYAENEEIKIQAELYNESYENITNAEISLRITSAEGKEYPFIFNNSETGYMIDAGYFPPGLYQYTASTEYNNQNYEKSGSFAVQAMDVEFQQSTANLNLMSQIASITGGNSYTLNESGDLDIALKNSSLLESKVISESSNIDLVSLKWIFFLLLVLISTEWFLRKYFGSI